MKSLRHLLPFIKENKWKYIVGILILILIDGLQLITPRIIGYLTDDLLMGRANATVLYKYMAIILGIAAGVAIGRFSWRMLIIGSSRRLEAWLRQKLFVHLETLPTSFFNTHKTGDLMALSTNDINSVRMAFGIGIVMITDAIFLTIMTLAIMMINLDWKLTLLAVLPMPIIAISVTLLGFRIRKRFKRVQEAFGHLTDKTQEAFSGIRIVKSFVQEDSELENFRLFNEDNYKANMSLVRIWSVMFPLVSLISALSLVVALAFGGRMVIDGGLTLGQFVSFITYLAKLTWPMMAIGWLVNMMQRGFVSLSRISEILDEEPAYEEDKGHFKPETLGVGHLPVETYNIAFKDVTYTYPGANHPALDKVSFEIENGKTLAIVGRTGAGKTTITNLLLRLFDGYEGEIEIGGRSITDYPVSQIRQAIGFVPQDNFLFSRSVHNNILFSGTEASRETVIDFAKLAQLHKEVESFPKGYETMLGERGVNLSGGQKQRLSIARALVKKPPILIFDDALSAVDTKTEDRLLEGLKTQTSDRTTIIIAHRISTVRHADHIVVIDEGKIVESGTHDNLVINQGIYADMHKKQMLEEQILKEA
ncbi:ABC transporter ATP-binding protein [Fusibacter sp. JL216-2]|uniref:ABC transporter ATP-binding protein n=1 Tax=Fusibacter sp. JL216-2 TaxID=3071453 RepID=UPI003D348DE1